MWTAEVIDAENKSERFYYLQVRAQGITVLHCWIYKSLSSELCSCGVILFASLIIIIVIIIFIIVIIIIIKI